MKGFIHASQGIPRPKPSVTQRWSDLVLPESVWASERRVLLIVEVCYTSSYVHSFITSSSHLHHIFITSSSHLLHIFFTSSSHLLHIFFTSSNLLLIFTHTLSLSLSPSPSLSLLSLPSVKVSLLLFLFSSLFRPRAVLTRRHEMAFRTKSNFDRQKLR